VGCTVPKIDCFEIAGLESWFWSNDHTPPHFHIKRAGKWELKVNFLENEDEVLFEREWGELPSSKVRKEIKRLVIANRAALLAEWEAKVNL